MHGGCSLAVSSSVDFIRWPRGPCLVVSILWVFLGCRVLTPDCCFSNPFLGAVRGGTNRCSSLTSWSVRGAGWFCLWALDLVEVANFPAGSGCELQESVAAVVRCLCCERGCWFARAAVGFVVGLRVHVGVSRRLREPTCGVAFTGVWLWSAEPVEDGCLVGFPLLVGLLPDVFDSAGSARVVFGLTRVVVELRWWDFVCPQDREVGFISRTLWALPDGGLTYCTITILPLTVTELPLSCY
ncbi:hypothetical protein Taro_004721 [Colocasia esculenta]|uniref:Uncharacterized protein n=1 Tax=Colocasia esculenta TaxID=4460 RepID=A0A843TKW3_COLES|nr:hypothetical protein [Colocasia esculenta]